MYVCYIRTPEYLPVYTPATNEASWTGHCQRVRSHDKNIFHLDIYSF
jgi:hypothetical protein